MKFTHGTLLLVAFTILLLENYGLNMYGLFSYLFFYQKLNNKYYLKYGTMEITCKQNGYRAIINFKPYSWSNKELNKVDGFIYDKKYVYSF
jgi:hypothetical protein